MSVEQDALIWMLYTTLGKRSLYKNKINVDGMPPSIKSPERQRFISSKYYGIAHAIKQTGYLTTLKKIRTCVCMSCASISRTRNPKNDMIKLAGRRPAKKLTHCTAVGGKERFVCCYV